MNYPKKAAVKRAVKFRAELDGSKYYYTGKPCKYGHYDWRLTSTGNCLECKR